jgi:hypothetical protein
MSEDRDSYYKRCVRLFERELQTVTGINPHRYRANEESAPRVEMSEMEDILATLECLTVMGKRLVMASRETLIDGLQDVVLTQDRLCLFGANVDNDEHGYLIRPRALYVSFGEVPENTCVVLDNIPRPADLLERKAEVGQTAFVTMDSRSYTFIDLQAGHNPLLIFAHGAAYGIEKKAIVTAIDALCENDLRELPLFRKP